MRQALYRKYRSVGFDEVIGQPEIIQTLKQAVAGGKVSHAYLFTGPRGVGKTSVARILAYELNSVKYGSSEALLDIIEIDAASNRRIDEVRDLRDKVNIAPARLKYKVYIIDEVHMLTKEAFNALLKTLEEPPEHCIFILATTELNKVPATIVSRTQKFNFKAISDEDVSRHINQISKKEKLSLEPTAADLIAEFAGGSLRDAISILDQLSSKSVIKDSDVEDLLGIPPKAKIETLIGQISKNHAPQAIESIRKLIADGYSPVTIAELLAKYYTEVLLSDPSHEYAIKLVSNLLEVSSNHYPEQYLEIVVVEACLRPDGDRSTSITKRDDQNSQLSPEPPKSPPKSPAPVVKQLKSKPHSADDFWQEILDELKSVAPSLYTAARLAEPSYQDGNLELTFQFALHKNKFALAENKKFLLSLLKDKFPAIKQVSFSLKQTKTVTPPPAQLPKTEPENNNLQAITNIFGGAEVLES